MKKLILAAAIMISTLSFAQKGDKEKLTPEQRVEKQLQHMTTTLSLTEKQQGEVKIVLLKQSKKMEAKRAEMKAARERGETPSDEQRADMKKKMIDDQLEMKTKMKKILSEDQLKKMKESRRAAGKQMREKRRDGKKGAEKMIERK